MTSFCIRCTEAHSDDSPICQACQYAESPADYAEDEETICTLTLDELNDRDPAMAEYRDHLRAKLRSELAEWRLTETIGDPFKSRKAA